MLALTLARSPARSLGRRRLAALVAARSWPAISRWNNAPHVSTALPPERVRGAAPGHAGNETVAPAQGARLAAAAAPDRRDRVELIGMGYRAGRTLRWRTASTRCSATIRCGSRWF